tara:strand:- start:630 stop:953 length:324 start_codon:yes stop_codon:yes gene_type:complete
MKKNIEKPTSEAKALSLFLMAYKSKDPVYKEKAKRINRLWDLVVAEEITKDEYLAEVQQTIKTYGGYTEIIEKTVQFYIDKTGEWNLKGDDRYCIDAKKIADRLLKK